MSVEPSKSTNEIVWMGGIGVIYRVPATATDRAFSIIEHVIRPGVMSAPHTHSREHEFSYVLEGVLGAEIGDEVVHARPGEFAIKPKGVPHVFWNEGPGILRFLEVISPAGMEQFFKEASRLVPPKDSSDEAKLGALSEKYGMSVQLERIPELARRFGVRLFG